MNSTMLEWPHLIYIALTLALFGFAVFNHGKMIRCNATVVAIVYLVSYIALHWGGFFK